MVVYVYIPVPKRKRKSNHPGYLLTCTLHALNISGESCIKISQTGPLHFNGLATTLCFIHYTYKQTRQLSRLGGLKATLVSLLRALPTGTWSLGRNGRNLCFPEDEWAGEQ